MEENEEFDSDFSTEDIPISEGFWNYMENYWHNNREFPESTESSLNKKADLIGGKVPASQLPSYVDDVLEFDSFENLPNPGEKGKIYLITNDNSQFRWSGSEYIQLNSDEFLMTTNTNQTITGRKEFITEAGNTWDKNSLMALGTNGSKAGMTFYSHGMDVGQMNFDGYFNFKDANDDNFRYIKGSGFIKENSNDDYILTGGGGHINKHTKEDSYFHSSRNFTEGTLIKTTVDYSQDYGHQFLLEMKGNMYSGNLPLEMKVQGYIYFGKIISERGYSTYSDLKVITALNLDGKLCFWFPRLGYWQGFSAKLTTGYGGLENGINRVTAIEDSPDPQGTKRVEIYIDTLATQEWTNSKPFNSITYNDINNWNTKRFNKTPIDLITSSFNADTVNESGFYRIGHGTTNTGDYSGSNDGARALLHFETEGVYSASQIQTERYTGNILSRTRNDGGWTAWIRHWGNNDFTQQDVNNWKALQLASDESVTKSTNQIISGLKSFITGGGNYAPFNNALQIYADDGSLPSMTWSKSGSHVGQLMFNSDGFHFKNGDNDNYYRIKSDGFKKNGFETDDWILVGSGNAINKNEFATSSQLGNNDRNYLTDSRGAIRPPSFYDDRYAQWDFQHGNDTLASGDPWQGVLTVAKWESFNIAHKQEQLLFTGDDLKRRTAIDDDNWGVVKTIWDSGNLNPSSFVSQATLDNYLLKSGGTMTGMVNFSNNTGGISGTMGDNDFYRIIGRANGSDNGYLEIATADGGVEGVHVTQYTGQFITPVRTAKLLDENGNTYFPQNVTAEYAINAGSDSQISGRVFGKRELVDATGLNQDTYYPVVIKLPNLYTSKIKAYRTLDSSMGVPAYSEHGAGFWCYFEFDDYGRGWGLTDNLSVCNYQQQNWTNIIPIGYSTINESSDSIVWVRGGSKYWIDVNSNTPIVLYTNGYTSPYGQTVNPTTVRPWIDINKNTLSKDLINYWSKSEFNIADYATQAWVTSQGYLTSSNLNDYATQSWVSANFPNQTLSIDNETNLGQTLTLSNGNAVTITNNFITSSDGTRNPNDVKPNTSGKRVRFDFANASSVKGSGNYAGVMTYAPWDGTTASTGDSSYQLAFANQTGINGEGIPMLKLRKGIDDKWSSDWYKMWSEGDFSQSDINNWNNIANTAATQSWVQSQNYAPYDFVEAKIDELKGEIVDPAPAFAIKNEFTTVILTDNHSGNPLELEGELIPESFISIINLSEKEVDLNRDGKTIDRIYEHETSEYYITKEGRLIKKGTYKSAQVLI